MALSLFYDFSRFRQRSRQNSSSCVKITLYILHTLTSITLCTAIKCGVTTEFSSLTVSLRHFLPRTLTSLTDMLLFSFRAHAHVATCHVQSRHSVSHYLSTIHSLHTHWPAFLHFILTACSRPRQATCLGSASNTMRECHSSSSTRTGTETHNTISLA